MQIRPVKNDLVLIFKTSTQISFFKVFACVSLCHFRMTFLIIANLTLQAQVEERRRLARIRRMLTRWWRTADSRWCLGAMS